MPRPFNDPVAVKNHVDIQSTVTKTRPTTIPPMRILERMQPGIKRFQRHLRLQQNAIVEKIRPIEPNRRRAISGRHAQIAELSAQRQHRCMQVVRRAQVAAKTEKDGSHAIFAHAHTHSVNHHLHGPVLPPA